MTLITTDHRLANYGPWATSCPFSVFVQPVS